MKIRGGAAGRREPLGLLKEVTVSLVGLRRLLLFIIVNMDEQSQNAHDQLTDQDQFRMSHHITTSPQKRGGFVKEVWPPQRTTRMRGLPACRIPAAPAHIRCAEAIIARYVEFGKQGKNFKDNT